MFNYLVAIVAVLPLIGIYQMEAGAHGISIGAPGYPNGSFWAYLVYAAVLLLTYFSFKKKDQSPLNLQLTGNVIFYRCAINVAVLHLLIILCMLFVFKAYLVWTGQMGKGQFRANLGPAGALAYMMTKYISPCMLAYTSYLYTRGRRNLKSKIAIGFCLLLGIILGATWGFKSTGISLILASILILYWKSSFWGVTKAFSVAATIIVVMAIIFDDGTELKGVLEFLWTRLTVIQGDVSWLVWGKYTEGYELPAYLPTLWAAFGDRFLSVFMGISKDNYAEWAQFHFDIMINDVAGVPLFFVEAGHNVVGTPFSEGVIMFGLAGAVIFAALGGGGSAYIYNKINKAMNHGDGISVALWATYFCVFVFSWLRGGAVVQLIHISVIFGFVISYFSIILIRRLRLWV